VIEVFVINSADAASRMAAVASHLRTHSLSFRRWPATRGTEIDPAAFSGRETAAGVRFEGFTAASANEAACGLSHIRLLRHVVRERLPWAVVLEDDAVVMQAFSRDIASWQVPPDADIVLLNGRARAGDVSHVGESFSYGEVTGGAGTEGYLVSLTGARKLLRVLSTLRAPLDFQMYAHFESVQSNDRSPFHWRMPRNPAAHDVDLLAYRVFPSVVAHDGDEISTIGAQRHPHASLYCKLLLGMEYGYGYPAHERARAVPPKRRRAAASIRPDRGDRHGFVNGVDVSHIRVGAAKALMAQLRESGVDAIRLSLWVDQTAEFNLSRALRLARYARICGLDICLVLHFSDTWADPGCQRKPSSWSALSYAALRERARSYTRGVMIAFSAQGTPPATVQIGNEITAGFLWAAGSEPPECGGRLNHETADAPASEAQWHSFTGLLKSAIDGVQEALAEVDASTEVMLHIDRGADVDAASWWLAAIESADVQFDAIGLSFNPQWHPGAVVSRVDGLRRIADELPTKRLVIAETAYPYRPYECDGILHREGEFPFTPEGQAEYLRRMRAAVAALPTGAGLFWWGALFTHSEYGLCTDSFAARALFDAQGNCLPALSAFGERW
jgi:arabinogalactan endo-1,4-beta-galactosidase